MEFGLRHYESAQRLGWLVLILLCLALAYPASGSYVEAAARLQPPNPVEVQTEFMKSMDFWRQGQWIATGPLGRLIVFLALSAWYFWLFRALWLLVQWLGKWLMSRSLREVTVAPPTPAAGAPAHPGVRPELLLPAEPLRRIARPPVLRILFIAHRRLYLLLSGVSRVLSSEALLQRETRLEAIDWQLAASTWGPYRAMIRVLPALALVQGGWSFYLGLLPLLDGQADLQTVPALVLLSLLPPVQMAAVSIGLSIARGLLERLEQLQLARLDGLFFDRLLSRLPLQSSDTLLLLNALERHVKELHAAIRRLEEKLAAPAPPP